MATIIIANVFVFLIVYFMVTFKGLDLKKWSSWLYGLYGFLTGFLVGFLSQDNTGDLRLAVNLAGSLQVGALFAFIVIYTGAMNRWHRQRFMK